MCLLGCDNHPELFLEFVKRLALNQHVLDSTNGNNILDLVFSSDQFSLSNCTVCEPIGSRDHNNAIL